MNLLYTVSFGERLGLQWLQWLPRSHLSYLLLELVFCFVVSRFLLSSQYFSAIFATPDLHCEFLRIFGKIQLSLSTGHYQSVFCV